MRGHETLIQLRKAGRKPNIVFINDWPCRTNWFESGEQATISTDCDSLSSIDLRCVVGLTVNISSMSEQRAKALFNKAKEAGAKTVAACHAYEDGFRVKSGWTEVHHA